MGKQEGSRGGRGAAISPESVSCVMRIQGSHRRSSRGLGPGVECPATSAASPEKGSGPRPTCGTGPCLGRRGSRHGPLGSDRWDCRPPWSQVLSRDLGACASPQSETSPESGARTGRRGGPWAPSSPVPWGPRRRWHAAGPDSRTGYAWLLLGSLRTLRKFWSVEELDRPTVPASVSTVRG